MISGIPAIFVLLKAPYFDSLVVAVAELSGFP